METEQGIVEKVEAGWAWVSVERKGGCSHCSQKGHCNMVEGKDRMELKADNGMGAHVGDEVDVVFSSGTRLKVAFLAYIVPVIGLLIGAILGSDIGTSLGWSKDLGSVLFAIAGLVLAFLITRVFDRVAGKKSEFIPRVSRIR